MSFARGRFGVEYHPRKGAETHRLRGLARVALVLVAIAFIWYKVSHRSGKKSEEAKVPDKSRRTETITTAESTKITKPLHRPVEQSVRTPMKTRPGVPTPPLARPSVARPPTSNALSPSVRTLVARLEETRDQRPTQDRVQIEKYAAAERQQNLDIAGIALRQLYDRPTMADMRDQLLRRLGDINRTLLFSDKTTQWTTAVTVRRGDGRERIAHEHRNTPAIVAKLNSQIKWERLRPGDTVRVLRFPYAVLVIHKQSNPGYADLTLRKEERFFCRYNLSVSPSASCNVYDITAEAGSTLGARFRELGVRTSAEDRHELEMFLAPGSQIIVTE